MKSIKKIDKYKNLPYAFIAIIFFTSCTVNITGKPVYVEPQAPHTVDDKINVIEIQPDSTSTVLPAETPKPEFIETPGVSVSHDSDAPPNIIKSHPLPSDEYLIAYYSDNSTNGSDAWDYYLYAVPGADGFYDEMTLIIRDEENESNIYAVTRRIEGDLSEPEILLADVNFDGYTDVLFTEGPIGAHGHFWYHLLLRDPANGEFNISESFYNIANLEDT